ncbi:DUF72 domain-containing protein [Muricoccus radiodurans]|uniref:DUF72 domain-containing protein n=1 Tax=Muricoccus radiodurans TaxID=2231721 RepID=UPI003CFAC51F
MPDREERTGSTRVGIAGWTFPPWRGSFYPKGLKQKDELSHASNQFATLEINGTFYSLQKPETFRSWAAATPDGFVFSMKAPQYVTHMRRLKDVEAPIANFFASGLFALGPKLGPILWQIPPKLPFDRERIETWLKLLPKHTMAAAAMARRHEPRLEGRALTEPEHDGPIRHAVEVRHESYADPAFIGLLREHNVALVLTDGVEEYPRLGDVTADFVYVRLHVSKAHGEGGYGHAALDAWADRSRVWSKGGEPEGLRRVAPEPPARLAHRDVFLYLDAAGDEEVKLFTPPNATALADRLRPRS